jgi:hypothetical protein
MHVPPRKQRRKAMELLWVCYQLRCEQKGRLTFRNRGLPVGQLRRIGPPVRESMARIIFSITERGPSGFISPSVMPETMHVDAVRIRSLRARNRAHIRADSV